MEDAQEPRSDHEGISSWPDGGATEPDAGGGWVPPSRPEQAGPGQSGSWAPPPPAHSGHPGSSAGWGPAWPPPPSGGPNPYGHNPYGQNPPGPAGGPYGGWQNQWGAPQSGWPGGPGGPGQLPPGQSPWDQNQWGQSSWGWNPGTPPRPRRTLPGAITALLLAVAVLVGLGLGHGVWRAATSTPTTNSANNGNGFANPFGDGGSGSGSGSANASSIAARVAPELVDINTNLFAGQGQAAGTGIVLTPEGLVLTNNHVIAGASQVEATDVGNGQQYSAKVVGYDRTHDVALIQLQGAKNLPTASIGDSSRVSVGDSIIGIGNAGGVGGTPSSVAGTVTALNQSITATDQSDGAQEQLSGLIQVNANIQPGDSGGSLVNTQGQVVGIDTAASQTFSFDTNGNQGFAIPINQAIGIVHTIQAGQTTNTVHIGDTAFLGVYVDTQTTGSSNSGAVLSRVVPNGPAANAGLAGGDVITSLNSHTVASPADLTNLLVPYHPGDKVQVGWSDANGVTHRSTVTLANGPAA